MEENYFRRMDAQCDPRRIKIEFPVYSKAGENKGDQVWFADPEQAGGERNLGLVGKTSDRGGTSFPNRDRVLQHFLHGPKERWGHTADPEFKAPQQTSLCSSFQDGNLPVDSSSLKKRGLGIHHRSGRCLFSHPDISRTSAISKICVPGKALSISSPPLWNCNRSQNIHQDTSNPRGVSTWPKCTHFYVPRRLANPKPKQGASLRAEGVNPRLTGYIRSYTKQEKISARTNADNNISWSSVQFKIGNDLPYRGKIPENGGTSERHGSLASMRSAKIPANLRIDDLLFRFNPESKTTDETHSIPLFETMEYRKGYSEEINKGRREADSSSKMVDVEGEFLQRGTLESTGEYHTLDRCVRNRLGSTSEVPTNQGSLGPSTKEAAYKLAGAESSPTGSQGFSTSGRGTECVGKNRQFDGCRLHQQRRRNKISATLSPSLENIQLDRQIQNNDQCSSHPREEKCISGQIVKGSRQVPIDRMVPRQQYRRKDISSFRQTKYRSLRHSGEQKTTDFLFPMAHRRGVEYGCHEHKLARNVCVCLSATDANSEDSFENTARAMHADLDCTSKPTSILVSNAVGINSRSPKTTARDTKSVNTERLDNPPESNVVEVSSVEDFGITGIDKGFSRKAEEYILASRRPSTRKVYKARQRVYQNWCVEQKIDPCTASVSQIADFLIYLHEEKKV